MSSDSLSLSEARRIALAAQGFDRPRPTGRVDARHVRRTIKQLGLLQIDYVNVLAPAHYQVLFSRLGPYDRTLLDDLVHRRREFTEHWAHEASIVPIEAWPLLGYRRDTHRVRPYGFETFLDANAAYAEWVLNEVRTRGALTADDLIVPEGIPRRLPESWFGTISRAVLEAHFGRGLLAIADRLPNFARVFDITERVIPAEYQAHRIGPDEARRELLRRAAAAHGVGTAGDLADYYRMQVRDARPRLAELVDSGDLRAVRVESWRETAYLSPTARVPASISASTLLSPFDPVIWFRQRAARLFGFDYRVEIFVPQEKRRWGFYVLPFLLGDRLVARVDLKADRSAKRLLVLAAYLEPATDGRVVVPALAAELHTLATWLGLESVAVEKRGNLARRLSSAL